MATVFRGLLRRFSSFGGKNPSETIASNEGDDTPTVRKRKLSESGTEDTLSKKARGEDGAAVDENGTRITRPLPASKKPAVEDVTEEETEAARIKDEASEPPATPEERAKTLPPVDENAPAAATLEPVSTDIPAPAIDGATDVSKSDPIPGLQTDETDKEAASELVYVFSGTFDLTKTQRVHSKSDSMAAYKLSASEDALSTLQATALLDTITKDALKYELHLSADEPTGETTPAVKVSLIRERESEENANNETDDDTRTWWITQITEAHDEDAKLDTVTEQA